MLHLQHKLAVKPVLNGVWRGLLATGLLCCPALLKGENLLLKASYIYLCRQHSQSQRNSPEQTLHSHLVCNLNSPFVLAPQHLINLLKLYSNL